MRSICLAVLSIWAPSVYASAINVPFGTADSFAVLGGSTVTSTGPTVIGGNVGVFPGTAITGLTPGMINGGVIHAGDATAMKAQADALTGYNFLAALAPDQNLTGHDLGGLTLTPGVYKFDSSAQLTGALTLNFQGRQNALFVSRPGARSRLRLLRRLLKSTPDKMTGFTSRWAAPRPSVQRLRFRGILSPWQASL